jgi:hypothetical protein
MENIVGWLEFRSNRMKYWGVRERERARETERERESSAPAVN